MKKECIVAILFRWDSVFKPAVLVICRVKAVAPCFGAERGIGNTEIKGF